MKWFITLSIFSLVLVVGVLFFNNYLQQNDTAALGGERTIEGCLFSAGYSFNSAVGACLREWEMTPDIIEASRMAVEHRGKGYALTVVSFNSYEEEGSYDIFLERGDERTPETVHVRKGTIVSGPSHEEAELVGFQFMQDVIAVAPPSSDMEAATRLYDSLSSDARKEVGRETLARDMAFFVGIQDVPDLGVSVEDLEIIGLETGKLTLGLNYSGTRVLRIIHMVVEGGSWKVDQVSAPTNQENDE